MKVVKAGAIYGGKEPTEPATIDERYLLGRFATRAELADLVERIVELGPFAWWYLIADEYEDVAE